MPRSQLESTKHPLCQVDHGIHSSPPLSVDALAESLDLLLPRLLLGITVFFG